MAKEQPKLHGKLVYYVGKDPKYAKNLRDRYLKEYSYIDGLEFVAYSNFEPARYEEVFLELVEVKPMIIYIDFTGDIDSSISLTNLVTRDLNFSQSATVCLVDSEAQLPKARLTQADFIHIKCGEVHDVLYDPLFLTCKKLLHLSCQPQRLI